MVNGLNKDNLNLNLNLNQGRHDKRGCYSGCGSRPERMETKDKDDPWEIGKRPSRRAR